MITCEDFVGDAGFGERDGSQADYKFTLVLRPPGSWDYRCVPHAQLEQFKGLDLICHNLYFLMLKCVIMKPMVQNMNTSNIVCQKKRLAHTCYTVHGDVTSVIVMNTEIIPVCLLFPKIVPATLFSLLFINYFSLPISVMLFRQENNRCEFGICKSRSNTHGEKHMKLVINPN